MSPRAPQLYLHSQPLHAVAGWIFASKKSGHILHLLLSFGLAGLFLVSIVDSSFVPLPIPGVTDIMVVVMAAEHMNVFLVVGIATIGSLLGGYFSWKIGQAGGMALLEKHVSKRLFNRVRDWMEHHAILSVALPAILPPPMPLAPFVLAAGALRMSRKKFMITFGISRFVRHAAAAAIGIHYGKGVLTVWNFVTQKYGALILSILWAVILLSVAYAGWKLYKISHSIGGSSNEGNDSDQKGEPARA
jgi:membrane protein YqaA with SNARE-associated domain